jgi:hypothetical protein
MRDARGRARLAAGIVAATAAVWSCRSGSATGPASVASVVVVPGSATMYFTQTRPFSAVALTSGGDTVRSVSVTWTSTDTSVATVSVAGVAAGRAAGQTQIVAAVNGISGHADLMVSLVAVASVTVSPAGDTVGEGDTLQLAATPRDSAGAPLYGREITWSTSDSTRATVSPSGLVTDLDSGAVTLTATSEGRSGASTLLALRWSTAPFLGAVPVDTSVLAVTLSPGGFLLAGGVHGLGWYHDRRVIYGGGVLYGTSANDVVIGYDPGTGRSLVEPSVVYLLPPAPGAPYGSRTWARIAPAVGGTAGLIVNQETFSFGALGDSSNFALLRFTFSDTSASAITGFYAGWVMDWDLYFDAIATNDAVRWDSALGVGEATESDTITYPQILAMVPSAASGAPSFRGWTIGSDPAAGSDFFADLSGGVDSTTIRLADVRDLAGVGPLTIPAGGHVVVYFALVGGDDRAAFQANLTAARTKIAALGY